MRLKAIISHVVVFASLVVMFGIHPSIFAAEEASSIMCDEGVVNIGDLDVNVQAKCGEPNSRNYELNQWVYNFGPSQPVYTLIFKEGQLIKILEDEWGS